ncbi:hypothetical protein R9X47_20360 [Wukongibacter baidiensis]|uniref:hypothetical protein n=1 Tax=Wukongibacter baidiensis TaxID=1723361 RepID=UPI003D7F6294
MKRVLLVLLSVILIISLVACKKNDFDAYIKAVNKTNEIKRGQESINYKMNIDFDTEGLTSEEIKDLKYFKNFESKFNLTFDNDLNKTIGRNYFNFGGLGFDMTFYNNGKESFIKMPILGKYLVLDEKLMGNYLEDKDIKNEGKECISEKTIEELGQNWIDTIKRDDVFAGKDSVMTTPEGEVKVTEYTIKLTGEQFKKLLTESGDILLKDKELKETIEAYVRKSVKEELDFNFNDAISNFKEAIKESKFENLSYIAFIDIDGYIVKEKIEFNIRFTGEKHEGMNGFEYYLEMNRWDIEKEQEFKFPELTEENTMDTDEIDQGIPFMFESLFEKKE